MTVRNYHSNPPQPSSAFYQSRVKGNSDLYCSKDIREYKKIYFQKVDLVCSCNKGRFNLDRTPKGLLGNKMWNKAGQDHVDNFVLFLFRFLIKYAEYNIDISKI